MSEHPSRPSMKAYAQAEPNGEHPVPKPDKPKRTPEVNEAILERATAKLEALSNQFEKMIAEVPTKGELQAVYLEVRGTRKLLDAHLLGVAEDRKALNQRLDAMMGLLGEVLGRLPEKPAGSSES